MPLYIMKQKIIDAYPGYKWKAKVLKMSDSQIVAVYNRLIATGKIK